MIYCKQAYDIDIHVYDICFVRATTNFLSSIIVMIKNEKHCWKNLPKHFRFTTFMRACIGLFNCKLQVLLYMWLPVFISTAIMNTMTFWVAICGFIINNETIKRKLIYCMIGCFCGSIMLIWPDKKGKEVEAAVKTEKPPATNSAAFAIPPLSIGVISGFVMVILYSIVQVLTRRMKSVHFSVV